MTIPTSAFSAVLILFSVLAACDSGDHATVDALGQAGGAGAPADGAGGSVPLAGGGGAASVDQQVSVSDASREGSTVTVTLESSGPLYGIWAEHCASAPRLLIREGEQWVELQDDRPDGYAEGYYLDGIYQPNDSLGCDGGDTCYERDTFALSTIAYVQTSSEQPPAEARPAPGAAGASALPALVPVVESQDTTGTYALQLTHRPGTCTAEEVTIVLPLTLD